MRLTTTQIRKYFHNLNSSGDKYRANIAHQAIRLLQADDAPAASKLLASIGFQTNRESSPTLRPRMDSVYAVPEDVAKAYNDTHKQSKISGFRGVVYGQSNWRLETTGKRKPASNPELLKRSQFDSLESITSRDKNDHLVIRTVTLSGKVPQKRLTRIRSLASVLTRAMQLLETAQYAPSDKAKMRQITRARKMLRFVETALPMQAEYRQRFAAALALATRMESAITLKGKLLTATLIPQGIEMPDVPIIKIVAL